MEDGFRQIGLEAMQAIEASMLEWLDGFCQQHGLRLYLCGGTLLGAVRHQGFIPWDDDIDVCLPRPDYRKLIVEFEKAKNESRAIPSNYQLAYTGNGFDRPFLRLYDTNTHIEHTAYDEAIMGSHVWLDVLPVDGLPEDLSQVRNIYQWQHIWSVLLLGQYYKKGAESSTIKAIARSAIKPISRLIGTRRASDKIDALSQRVPYETADYVGIISNGLYGAAERIPKEAFEASVSVQFCGRSYQATSYWHEYLSNLYGDYMTPPKTVEAERHFAGVWAKVEEDA